MVVSVQWSFAIEASRVNFLPGDADRAGERVNALDLGYVKARVNRVAGETAAAGATYSAFADVNGDGRINAIDLGAVKARQNDALPEATVGAAGEAVVARGGAVDLLEDTAPIL